MGAAIGNVMDTLLARRSFRPGTRVLVTGHPALAHAFAEQLRGTSVDALPVNDTQVAHAVRTGMLQVLARSTFALARPGGGRSSRHLHLPAAAEDLNMFNRAFNRAAHVTLAAAAAAGITVLAQQPRRPPPRQNPWPRARGAFPVAMQVDASKSTGPLEQIWRYFGADEPNYVYMKDGQKLIADYGALAPKRVYHRAHSLLVTGDGTPALKWGSTNAYREDAQGKPIYDWTIIDRIFDTYLKRGVKPHVQIGFMPEAMSVKPEPYKHSWTPKAKYDEIYTGWAYPPKDFKKWGDLVYEWAKHCVEKYGKAEVETWALGNLTSSPPCTDARSNTPVMRGRRLLGLHQQAAARANAPQATWRGESPLRNSRRPAHSSSPTRCTARRVAAAGGSGGISRRPRGTGQASSGTSHVHVGPGAEQPEREGGGQLDAVHGAGGRGVRAARRRRRARCRPRAASTLRAGAVRDFAVDERSGARCRRTPASRSSRPCSPTKASTPATPRARSRPADCDA